MLKFTRDVFNFLGMNMQANKKGKKLLVESCSSNNYQNLSKVEKFKSLTEKANQLWVNANLDKLDENFKKDLSKLNESSHVNSSVLNRVMAHLEEKGLNPPTLYKFPISKVNTVDCPNINNRVYGADLWDNVLNNQRDTWQYNTGLTDHPQDDGHFMDQGIVWLDGERDGDIIYGIGALVGKAKELAQDIMAVGGKIGFSTAGYGDVLDNGVVDPNTYEIERFADLVLNPSQGVFGNYEDVANKSINTNETVKKTIKESVMNKKHLKEDINITAEDIYNYLDKLGVQKKFDCTEFNCSDGVVTFSWDSGDGDQTWTATETENGILVACDGSEGPAIIKAKDAEDLIFKSDYYFEGCLNFVDNWSKFEKDFDDIDTSDIIKQLEEDEMVEDEEVAEEEVTEDEEETLSEQLIKKHYLSKINEIAKRPGREWESKIKNLEGLVKLANKEALSEKTKKELNTKVNSLINGIMKETSNIISKGWDAKELCESIGISDIKLLSGINSTVEEFAALKESFVKTRKTAKKYKDLNDAKRENLIEYAKNNVVLEKKIEESSKELNTYRANNKALRVKLEKVLAENKELKIRKSVMESTLARYEKALKESRARGKEFEAVNKEMGSKVRALSKANNRYVAEARKYEMDTTSFKPKLAESNFLREDSEIRNIFESAGKKAQLGNRYKTAQEAKNAVLFENSIIDEDIPFKSDDVNSLSELFN